FARALRRVRWVLAKSRPRTWCGHDDTEKTTGVPKAYAVIGLVALYFFLIIFNLGGQLLTNLAGFVLPGYYSLNALFTASKQDDTQWLT
ncbi:hypothetical protein KEM56_005182, partial [Ascosphaera pollenicola]